MAACISAAYRLRIARPALRESMEPAGRCEIDGMPLKHHPTCRVCGILMGPAHYERESEDGLCEACW